MSPIQKQFLQMQNYLLLGLQNKFQAKTFEFQYQSRQKCKVQYINIQIQKTILKPLVSNYCILSLTMHDCLQHYQLTLNLSQEHLNNPYSAFVEVDILTEHVLSNQYQNYFLVMGCISEMGKRIHYLEGGAILGQDDRRVKVRDKLLEMFPYNTIGYIRSKQRSDKQDQPSPDARGTGFLISDCLVLTSCHNFAMGDETNTNVKELLPISFNVLVPGKHGLVQKSRSIKATKLNPNFMSMLSKIVLLKKICGEEKNQEKKLKLLKDILVLEGLAVQHDFALLQLDQKLESPRYFQLSPNLCQKAQVTVTGYEHQFGVYSPFSDSNIFDSIQNAGIYYDIDTKSGQSGSPVYLSKDNTKLVGIHKDHNPIKKLNFATMITDSVIAVLKIWTDELCTSFGRLKTSSNKLIPIKQVNNNREEGDQFRNQGQFEEALQCYNRALSIFEKLSEKETVEYAQTLSKIGWVHLYNKKYQQSLYSYFNELRIYDILKHQSLEKAIALTGISIVYNTLYKQIQANQYYQKAVQIYKKIGTASIKCPFTLNSIGLMYRCQNLLRQALEYYERALALHQQTGKKSIVQAIILNNIGFLYEGQGQLKQTLKYYDRAVDVYQNIGNRSIGLAITLNNIGIVYFKRGKDKQALNYYTRAITIYQQIGKESTGEANTLYNIGNIYDDQGKSKESLRSYDKALAIYQKIGQESIDWANTLNNIGSLYKQQSKSKQAHTYYGRALQIHQKIGKESIGWASTLNNIGFMYENQEKFGEAIEYYDLAVALYKQLGKESLGWANTLRNIGGVYKNQGFVQKAEQYFTKCQRMKRCLK